MDIFENFKTSLTLLVSILLAVMFVVTWIDQGIGGAIAFLFLIMIVYCVSLTLRGVGGWIEGGNQIQDGGLKVRKGKRKRTRKKN